jgi:acyl-CoA thioesterase II
MANAVDDLIATLDLERLEHNLFRGRSPRNGRGRVFGGQVVGQALMAATRTVEAERPPHSLHAYFLLGGDPEAPILYEVDRIRDGRSFTTRRVVAIQHGRAIFSMSASYHADEPGFDHGAPMPEVPPPEDLTDEIYRAPGVLPDTVRAYIDRERPIEFRPVEYRRYASRTPGPRFHAWMRAAERLPDDPTLHRCVLAYASDMTLLDASLHPHGRTAFEPGIVPASLDHALWFHRPFRADEWLLYAQDSPSASGARGFARGLVFTRDGTLVASTAQEGLIRERRDPSA